MEAVLIYNEFIKCIPDNSEEIVKRKTEIHKNEYINVPKYYEDGYGNPVIEYFTFEKSEIWLGKCTNHSKAINRFSKGNYEFERVNRMISIECNGK